MKKLICFIILFFGLTSYSIASNNINRFVFSNYIADSVSGLMYFDTSTGHKYVKTSNSTYSEYSKKGKLLKENIPNTQYHLNKSFRIIELYESSGLIYEKNINGEIKQMVLPGLWMMHPEGWKCKSIVK